MSEMLIALRQALVWVCGIAICALAVVMTVPYLKRRLLRWFGSMIAAWLRMSTVGKLLVPMLVFASVLFGSVKPRDARQHNPISVESPIQCVEVDLLHGYEKVECLPTEHLFERPENAITPPKWAGQGVCDDCWLAPNGLLACVGGVVASTPYAYSDWAWAGSDHSVYAVYPECLSILPGVSDFWCVTNDCQTAFVWKDCAALRNPTNLVSFAVQIHECGDVAYTYGTGFSVGHVSPFLQVCGERVVLDMTNAVGGAVLFKKNLLQDDEWWITTFPDLYTYDEQGVLVRDCDTNSWARIDIEFEGGDEESGLGRMLELEQFGKGRFKVVIYKDGAYDRGTLYHGKVQTLTKYEIKTGHMYKIVSEQPIKAIRSDVEIRTNKINSTTWEVWRPIELSISASDTDATNAKRCRANLIPFLDGGSYHWSVTGPFAVVTPDSRATDVLRTGSGPGSLTCRWSRDGISAEKTISIRSSPLDDQEPYLDLTVSPSVALTQEMRLDHNGAACGNVQSEVNLQVTYRGTTPGEIAIFVSDDSVRLADGYGNTSTAIYLPVEDAYNRSWLLNLSNVPSGTREIDFEARFVPQGRDEGFETACKLRFAKLTVEAEATWPDERRRHVFGVCENATATVEPSELTVRWNGGDASAESNVYRLNAPNIVCVRDLNVNIADASFSIPLRYIAPTGCVAISSRPMNDQDWADSGLDPLMPGTFGAGLFTENRLLPDYVSFTNVCVREGYSPAIDATGYFTHINIGPHDSTAGAGVGLSIERENGFVDRAGHKNDAISISPTDGSYRYEIPMSWSAAGAPFVQFATNVQSYSIVAEGVLRVSKFGRSVERRMSDGAYLNSSED